MTRRRHSTKRPRTPSPGTLSRARARTEGYGSACPPPVAIPPFGCSGAFVPYPHAETLIPQADRSGDMAMNVRLSRAEIRASEAETFARRCLEDRLETAERRLYELTKRTNQTWRDHEATLAKIRVEHEKKEQDLRRELEEQLLKEWRLQDIRVKEEKRKLNEAGQSVRARHDELVKELISSIKESIKLSSMVDGESASELRRSYRSKIREYGFEATSSPVSDGMKPSMSELERGKAALHPHVNEDTEIDFFFPSEDDLNRCQEDTEHDFDEGYPNPKCAPNSKVSASATPLSDKDRDVEMIEA